jgi:hypothetical protein
MVLELTEKRKINYASATTHITIIEKAMYQLSEQDIKMVRHKANEIRNVKDALIQPFIGLCVIRFVKKEELADAFSQMEDVFEFIKSLMPRRDRHKNTLREQHQLNKRKEEIERILPEKRKLATLMKNIGKFDDQEKLEKMIDGLELELENINNSLEEKEKLIIHLEQDMGGKIK